MLRAIALSRSAPANVQSLHRDPLAPVRCMIVLGCATSLILAGRFLPL
jgi:hypothetical protein